MSGQGEPAQGYFIRRQEAAAVLDACPDAQWRLLFALSRYGGLRCPSEHLGLRWDDIDWERSRMTIRSPKTEHHEGRTAASCHLLRTPAVPGRGLGISRSRHEVRHHPLPEQRRKNPKTSEPSLPRSSSTRLKPWPKLWHNLRATGETKLAETFPIHGVCQWIGNRQAVAKKHYLQTTGRAFPAGGRDRLQRTAKCSIMNAVKANEKLQEGKESPGKHNIRFLGVCEWALQDSNL